MVMEMFLTLGHYDPVRVLAWSTSKTGHEQSKSESDLATPTADTWDVKAVGDWLRKNNFESFVDEFEKQEIAGKELLVMDSKDLLETGCKYNIGQKIRFLDAIKILQEQVAQKEQQDKKKKASKPNLNRRRRYRSDADLAISMTVYWDSRASHLFASINKVVPEARLVIYKGINRHNNTKDPFLEGLINSNDYDPLISVIGKNCQISSVNVGGSGGQDRFTANISLIGSSFTYMYQQYPGNEAAHYANFFNRPHGAIVSYETLKNQTIMKEWGKQRDWSLETHFSFPQEFKMAVKTMLLIHKSKQDQTFSKIPSEILKYVFYQLSVDYIPTNPMEGILFPGRIKEQDKNKQNSLHDYSSDSD